MLNIEYFDMSTEVVRDATLPQSLPAVVTVKTPSVACAVVWSVDQPLVVTSSKFSSKPISVSPG